MKNLLFCVLYLSLTCSAFAEQVPTEPAEYTIGIKPSGPFAYKEGDEWKGVSVELVKRLSEKLGFTYEFVDVPTITALLGLAEFQTTDLAIGALSMTEEREKTLDFSHPYFQTTQGVITYGNGSAWHYAKFIGIRICGAFFVFLLALYTFGFVVYRLDPDDEINNIHKGAWFVLTTFTTTGYGDYVPRNAKAKIFAALLMIVSMFALSAFTGYIASALTAEKLSDDTVTLADLSNMKVVAVGGTTTDDLLNLLQIRHKRIATPENGVAMVSSKKVDAFVYDKAMLDYHALKLDNNLRVDALNRGQERYAIVFPAGSELREPFNRAILSIIDSPEWKNLIAQYFGN